ncbi:MAG TPA: hypothetical protein VE915_09945 [Actinomycetota bacterium]|nr:hypothetical protein [Actinomycetota bacterium]
MPWERRVPFVRFTTLAASVVLVATVGLAPAGASHNMTNEGRPKCQITHFNRNNFSNPLDIDNKWSPLVPGTQLIMEGVANRTGELLEHQVIFTVTGVTKVIDGVKTRVLWDRDINQGTLVEAELAFKAQDNAGNVWNLGEYPEEYENGEFLGAPSTWISGLGQAEGGLLMEGRPKVDTTYYMQGSVPPIDFLDCARAVKLAQRKCTPLQCYYPVQVTHERAPLEPAEGIHRKYYAAGVGNVLVNAIDNDPEGETLVLSQVVHLSPEALAQANREALNMDRRAYRVNKHYRRTQPARAQ